MTGWLRHNPTLIQRLEIAPYLSLISSLYIYKLFLDDDLIEP